MSEKKQLLIEIMTTKVNELDVRKVTKVIELLYASSARKVARRKLNG